MRNYDFSKPTFMKIPRKVLQNYAKSCQSRLVFAVKSI